MIKQTIHGVKKVTIGDVVGIDGRYHRNVFIYADDTEVTLTIFGNREDLELFNAVNDMIPMDTIEAPTDELPELLRKQAD